MGRYAVVGAGIAGLSTAYALARRGHSVTVFEQFAAFHDRGSSHGRSRIIRRAYPDKQFTEIMVEAYPLWAELEMSASVKLVHEVGLLYFGDQGSPNLAEVVRGLTDCHVEHSVLNASEVAAVSPRLRLTADEVAVWTPEAGWVDAYETLRALYGLAAHHGAEFFFATHVDKEYLEREFDGYAVCAGSWIREWMPLEVKITKQTFAYVDAQVVGPVWIDDAADLPYGFPSDDLGMKLALHSYGPEIQANDDSSAPDAATLVRLAEVSRTRFGIENPLLSNAKTCRYTNTSDEGFRFGRVGTSGVYCSACSGHAFKFGPWLGERVVRELV